VLSHQRRRVEARPRRSGRPRIPGRCPVGGAPAAAPSLLRCSRASPSAWRSPPGPAAGARRGSAHCSTAATAARPLWRPRAPPGRGLPQPIPAGGARRRVGTLPLFKHLMCGRRSACWRHVRQRAAALLSRRSRCARRLEQRVAGHGGRPTAAAAHGDALGCADAPHPARRGAERSPACGGQACQARAPCCRQPVRCGGGAERCSRRLRCSAAQARAHGQGLSRGAAGRRAARPPGRRGSHWRSRMRQGGGTTDTSQQHVLRAARSGERRVRVICRARGRAGAGSRAARQCRRRGAQGRRPRHCAAWRGRCGIRMRRPPHSSVERARPRSARTGRDRAGAHGWALQGQRVASIRGGCQLRA